MRNRGVEATFLQNSDCSWSLLCRRVYGGNNEGAAIELKIRYRGKEAMEMRSHGVRHLRCSWIDLEPLQFGWYQDFISFLVSFVLLTFGSLPQY